MEAEGVREGGRDGWRCWDGRGEAMGEGESKHKELKGHLTPPPLFSLFLLLLFLPPLLPNNEAGARMKCQRSVQRPVAPEQHCGATCPSAARCHSSQHTECLWCWRMTAVSTTAVQLPTRRHAAFMLQCLSAGIRENPLRSVTCHS